MNASPDTAARGGRTGPSGSGSTSAAGREEFQSDTVRVAELQDVSHSDALRARRRSASALVERKGDVSDLVVLGEGSDVLCLAGQDVDVVEAVGAVDSECGEAVVRPGPVGEVDVGSGVRTGVDPEVAGGGEGAGVGGRLERASSANATASKRNRAYELRPLSRRTSPRPQYPPNPTHRPAAPAHFAFDARISCARVRRWQTKGSFTVLLCAFEHARPRVNLTDFSAFALPYG